MSKKKSTAMESIIKKKRDEKGTLIQEIIDELQEKCRSSPQATYTSPGSRNFVRKLVRALERTEDAEVGNQAFMQSHVDTESSGESSDEIKSGGSSISLSLESDTASDSEPRSPMSSEPDYDWTADTRDAAQKMKEEEESVFWVPVQKSLPRTSSTLSILNSNVFGGESPCISPIRVQQRSKPFQWGNSGDTWGNTYRQNRSQPKRLIKIDESGIVDSGYSDRSTRSSATDAGASWSDFDNTHSPSDLDSFSGSYSKKKQTLEWHNINKSLQV